MTKPSPWTKFDELLEALAAEGALNRTVTVEALEQFACSFPEDVDRDMYRGKLGVNLWRLGNLAKASEIIGAIENIHEKGEHWRKLAEEQFRANDRENAILSLRRSEEAINSLKPEHFWERAEVLSLNARLLEDFGLKEDALAIWNRAVEVAKNGQATGTDSSDCSAVLTTIAKLLAESGRLDLAKSVADSITIPIRRKLALELIEKASLRK
jgi:tetratricopeptide (TPR) repeat protein